MAVRCVRAAWTACAVVLTLSIPVTAFADACDDARKALDEAREAMKTTMNAMKAADAAAAAAPTSAAAQQAAQRAEDAWLDANRNFRLKQAAMGNCKQTKVESKNGVFYPYGSLTVGMQWVIDLLSVGGGAGGNNAIAPGAVRESARQAGGAALRGLMVSLVADVEFTRAFGATTPSFLGGLRATKPLATHPEFRPFGEILVGIEHCGECQTNDVALEFGFGTGYQPRPWDRVGIVAEVSFRRLPGVEFAGTQRRIVGGVSYRLAPR